jgi:hypothetical protein
MRNNCYPTSLRLAYTNSDDTKSITLKVFLKNGCKQIIIYVVNCQIVIWYKNERYQSNVKIISQNSTV